MKRCSTCNRTYRDDAAPFCAYDGTTLMYAQQGAPAMQTIAAMPTTPVWNQPTTTGRPQRNAAKLLLIGGAALLLLILSGASVALLFYLGVFTPKPPAGAFPQAVGRFSLRTGPTYSKNASVKYFHSVYYRDDGERVEYILAECPSQEKAMALFNSWKGTWSTTSSSPNGARIVQLTDSRMLIWGRAYRVQPGTPTDSGLYWVDGSNFIELHSRSQAVVLEFEAALKGTDLNARPLKDAFPLEVGFYKLDRVGTDLIQSLKRDTTEAMIATYSSKQAEDSITYAIMRYASPERAGQALDDVVEESAANTISPTKVAEREELINRSGEKSGERVVMESTGVLSGYQRVAWTDGNTLFLVTSFHKDAVDFEKDLPR